MEPLFGVLLQGSLNDRAVRLRHARQIRIGRQVLHDDFLAAFAIERRAAGQHLEQHNAERVNVDLFAVTAFADLGRHVVERANALGVSATATRGDEF